LFTVEAALVSPRRLGPMCGEVEILRPSEAFLRGLRLADLRDAVGPNSLAALRHEVPDATLEHEAERPQRAWIDFATVAIVHLEITPGPHRVRHRLQRRQGIGAAKPCHRVE